jgi:hypothetical protein
MSGVKKGLAGQLFSSFVAVQQGLLSRLKDRTEKKWKRNGKEVDNRVSPVIRNLFIMVVSDHHLYGAYGTTEAVHPAGI